MYVCICVYVSCVFVCLCFCFFAVRNEKRRDSRYHMAVCFTQTRVEKGQGETKSCSLFVSEFLVLLLCVCHRFQEAKDCHLVSVRASSSRIPHSLDVLVSSF